MSLHVLSCGSGGHEKDPRAPKSAPRLLIRQASEHLNLKIAPVGAAKHEEFNYAKTSRASPFACLLLFVAKLALPCCFRYRLPAAYPPAICYLSVRRRAIRRLTA